MLIRIVKGLELRLVYIAFGAFGGQLAVMFGPSLVAGLVV